MIRAGVAIAVALALLPSAAGAPRVTLDQTLSVSVSGTGLVTSSPKGISCPGSCSASFPDKQVVDLSSSAGAGWHFVGWGGDCKGTAGCTVTMDSKRSVDATFEQDAPPPGALPQCADGKDNDKDGKIDLADPGCESEKDDSETPDPAGPPPPGTLLQCADGLDNDKDGKIDLADPGCANEKDDSESPDPAGPPTGRRPQCADGKDNDKDGKVVLADPGCANEKDDSESPDPGGAPAGTIASLPVGAVAIGQLPRFVFAQAPRVFRSRSGKALRAAATCGTGKVCSNGGDHLRIFLSGPASAIDVGVVVADGKGKLRAKLTGYDVKGDVVASSPATVVTPSVGAHIRIEDQPGRIVTVDLAAAGDAFSGRTPRVAGLDDIDGTFIPLPNAPAIQITSPEDGAALDDRDVPSSLEGRYANASSARICVTANDEVHAVPADCGDSVRRASGSSTWREVNPGLRIGRNVVTAWLVNDRGLATSDSIVVDVRSQAYDLFVQGVEVTQGTQRIPLPAVSDVERAPAALGFPRSSYPVGSYNGVPLGAGGKTVVRVYPAYAAERSLTRGISFPQARLYGYARLFGATVPLPGSPLMPDFTLSPPPVAPVTTIGVPWSRRIDPASAYTFTLPPTWAVGAITLIADLEGTRRPSPAPQECEEASCRQNNAFAVSDIRFTRTRRITIATYRFFRTDVTESLPANGPLGFVAAWEMLPFAPTLFVTDYQAAVDITAIARCNAADLAARRCSAQVPPDPNPARRDPNPARTRLENDLFDLQARFPNGADFTFALQSASPGVSNTESVAIVNPGNPVSVVHELIHLLHLAHSSPCNGGAANGQIAIPWPPDQMGFLQSIGLRRLEPSPYRIVAPADPNAPAATQWYDLMSYCGANQWISTRTWSTVLAAAAEGTRIPDFPPRGCIGGNPPGGVCPRRLKPSLRVAAYVDAYGNARIQSVRSGEDAEPFGKPSGYTFVARDSKGVSLGAVSALRTLTHGHLSVPDSSYLVGVVPARDAASVELVYDGKVIARFAGSPNAPAVAAPVVRLGSAGLEVSWRASDRDGGSLLADVAFSADGGRSWRTLTLDAAGGHVRLAKTLLTGSKAARVRVTVNDGFRAASAVSRVFAVPGRPPAITILDPRPGQLAGNDTALDLNGFAFDQASRAVSGKRLRWLVDGKVVATGERASAIGLAPGRRTIVLEARDSSGLRGRASVTVVVRAAAPQFVVLSAPHRISRKATRVLLRVASSLPASLTVAGGRFSVDRKPRIVRVPVRPGSTPIVLRLSLSASGKTARTIISVKR